MAYNGGLRKAHRWAPGHPPFHLSRFQPKMRQGSDSFHRPKRRDRSTDNAPSKMDARDFRSMCSHDDNAGIEATSCDYINPPVLKAAASNRRRFLPAVSTPSRPYRATVKPPHCSVRFLPTTVLESDIHNYQPLCYQRVSSRVMQITASAQKTGGSGYRNPT